MEKKFREWVIYGRWFQHPNGYPLKNLTTIEFESGPSLENDEKLKIIEHAAFTELLEIAQEMSAAAQIAVECADQFTEDIVNLESAIEKFSTFKKKAGIE